MCFGQVCLSPAETYFSNYHTQPTTCPSSLEKSLPLLLDQPPPKRCFALFSPFSSSLFPPVSLSVLLRSLHVDDLTQDSFANRKMMLKTYQIPSTISSAIDRSLTVCHRNDLSFLSLTSFVMLFVTHPLSPCSLLSELTRANTARSEVGGALGVLRAIRRDASVTTQASPYGQSTAFPATSLFRDGQSRWRHEVGKDSATEWDRERFLDHRDCRDPPETYGHFRDFLVLSFVSAKMIKVLLKFLSMRAMKQSLTVVIHDDSFIIDICFMIKYMRFDQIVY